MGMKRRKALPGFLKRVKARRERLSEALAVLLLCDLFYRMETFDSEPDFL